MRVFEDGDHLHGAVMTALAKLWPTGTAVLSGCEITGSPSALSVTVASGGVAISGEIVTVSGDTVSLTAAGVIDRYDLVCVDTSGGIVVVEGTEQRVVPPIPADTVPIAICLVEVGQSTLPADRVQDIRVLAARVVSDQITSRLVGRSNLFTIITPSDNIKASDDSIFYSVGTTTTLLREFEMGVNLYAAVAPATFRISFEMRVDDIGTNTVAGYIRKNGVTVEGGVFSTSSTTYEQFTADVELGGRDLIQLWGYISSTANRPGYYRNFRIGADYEEIELTPELEIVQTV